MSKKKNEYIDDGHTVYNMDGVDGPIWKRNKREGGVGLSRKERRAAIRAAFATYLPKILCIFFGFAIAVLVVVLWLK